MTQITNVMYIIIITISMSLIATFLTYVFDMSTDVQSLVKSIPHYLVNELIQHKVVL